jgi:hypothetical protein
MFIQKQFKNSIIMENQKYDHTEKGSRADIPKERGLENIKNNNSNPAINDDDDINIDRRIYPENPGEYRNPDGRSNNDPNSNQRDRSQFPEDWDEKYPPSGRNDDREDKDDEFDEDIDKDEDEYLQRNQKRDIQKPNSGNATL